MREGFKGEKLGFYVCIKTSASGGERGEKSRDCICIPLAGTLGIQSIFQLGGFALYLHAQRGFVAAVNNVNLTKT